MLKFHSRRNNHPFLLHRLKLFFSTTATATSPPHNHSFAFSYLINNCGFSPEEASKGSKLLRFKTPKKPDTVFAFFAAHGFTDTQTRRIVKKEIRLLSCNPNKIVLPKFQFLISKGATASDIVRMVTVSPRFLNRSLDKHLVPVYDFVRGFLLSDQQTIACLNRNSGFYSDGRVMENVRLLLESGFTRSGVSLLLRTWPTVLCSRDMLDTVEELKELGFNPSTKTFGVALLAKRTVPKAKWDEKIETFMKWGWSEEQVLEAFRKQPYCMLCSSEKIDEVFSFWVNELGFKALDLVRASLIFQMSLHTRVIPRATVLKFLISNGLRGEDASLNTPFLVKEKEFLQKFVLCFKEESSHLLKLYNGKMDLGIGREKKKKKKTLV